MESLEHPSLLVENGQRMQKVERGVRPLVSYALLVVAWQILGSAVPSYLLPSPYETLVAALSLAKSGELQAQAAITLFHLAGGVLLAAVMGTAAGLVVGLSDLGRDYFAPTIPFFQSVPGLCWSFIALIWFGLSPFGIIFVVFIGTFPNMLLNVWEGTKNVDRVLIRMAMSLGSSRWQLIRTIYLPSIFPYAIAGVRIILGLGWKVAVVAEMLLGGQGIGSALSNSAYALRMDLVFGWTLVLVILMFAIEYGMVSPVEKRIVQWKTS